MRISTEMYGMSLSFEAPREDVEVPMDVLEHFLQTFNYCKKWLSKPDQASKGVGQRADIPHPPEVEGGPVLPPIELVLKNQQPSSEPEWIMVYAYYCSGQGRTSFSAEDIIQMYKDTGRWGESQRKNFNLNLDRSIQRGRIESAGPSRYRMLENGLAVATEILACGPGKRDPGAAAKAVSGDQAAGAKTTDRKLSPLELSDVQGFWSRYRHPTAMDKLVLVAYLLRKIKGITNFTKAHVLTMLNEIGDDTNFDLDVCIKNARRGKEYITNKYGSKGEYRLTSKGEVHVESLKKTIEGI